MKTLCLDSSHRHLMIVLLKDNEVLDATILDCFKKQSETLFPEMIKILQKYGWKSSDIDEVIITDGPGSYTGVRIAMTVAKVLCTQMHIPLYCISTLQLYAGVKEDTYVMLDARSNRAYCALYSKGNLIGQECILTLSEIEKLLDCNSNWKVVTDGMIEGYNEVCIPFAEHFAKLKEYAKKVENIHTLTPRYLKDSSSYGK